MPAEPGPAADHLKDRLRADLTSAMKGRDELRTATLRMVLAAVSAEEVAGKEARELSDDEVQAVLRREAKKRREAAEAFAGAGRPQQAERERAEEGVLAGYLPAQLEDADLAALVADVVTSTGATGMKDMGRVMGAAAAAVAGRAEGSRVAAEVRRQLG
ncbi:GatB/YqeY domain-containing protein [Blastococcus sp. SYSU D00695]